MFEKKISLPEVEQLLREGIHQSEIARQLKVSKQAISKVVQRLKQQNDQAALSVSPVVARAIVGSKIDGMRQLKKINDVTIHEINLLNQKIKDADVALRETNLDEKVKSEKEQEREGLVFQRLKHIAEIRKQLGLLLDICKELYNAEENQHFQQTVLDAIGEVNQEVKDEIIGRLKSLRSTRSVFG
jgi:transposase